MTKDDRTVNIVVITILVSLVVVFFYLLDAERVQVNKQKETTLTKVLMFEAEVAYYEGQKDALNGDIRIEKIYGTDSSYRWVKSPWDDEGVEPMYNPQDGISVSFKKAMEKLSTK